VVDHGTWKANVFRKRVQSVERRAQFGDWLAVHEPDGRLIGFGVFNPRSEIGIRIVRLGEQPPDEPFWDGLIDRAIELRRDVLALDQQTSAYRLIHAESDGFPGLMVDRFNDVLSVEAFSAAMYTRAEPLVARIQARLGTKHWVLQTSPHMQAQEGFDQPPHGSQLVPRETTIQEYGTRFRVRFEGGHKTGFFCDQRENRRQLATFCKGKSVLDLCCYSGGFAVQAKKLGEADDVTAVDLDEAPLKLAKENADLNQVRVRCVQADVFAYMRDMLRGGRLFDVVVLDPPKLIRSRMELDDGTRKHFDLNRLAMQLVKPGGIFLSCTCAGLLTHESFLRVIHSAARQAGDPIPGALPGELPRRGPREMQILAKTGAAPDHPIGTNCTESEYLQAVWMRMG
jgi:23S rRNA (cytosine1962-C5)-methyltransferase